jgi:predicted nucleic acid-binding protein
MGQLNLLPDSLIYLDTVTIIYSVERFADYIAILDPMWQQLQSGTFRIMTSELALLETLVMPIRQANTDLISRYEKLLTSSEISLLPITQPILKNGATLRATANLRTPDSIHAATALDAGCTIFLTNDMGFRQVPGLSTVILKDVLNA